jgi:hypothetical protein
MWCFGTQINKVFFLTFAYYVCTKYQCVLSFIFEMFFLFELDCSEGDEEVNVNVSLSPSLQESSVGGGVIETAVPLAPTGEVVPKGIEK